MTTTPFNSQADNTQDIAILRDLSYDIQPDYLDEHEEIEYPHNEFDSDYRDEDTYDNDFDGDFVEYDEEDYEDDDIFSSLFPNDDIPWDS